METMSQRPRAVTLSQRRPTSLRALMASNVKVNYTPRHPERNQSQERNIQQRHTHRSFGKQRLLPSCANLAGLKQRICFYFVSREGNGKHWWWDGSTGSCGQSLKCKLGFLHSQRAMVGSGAMRLNTVSNLTKWELWAETKRDGCLNDWRSLSRLYPGAMSHRGSRWHSEQEGEMTYGDNARGLGHVINSLGHSKVTNIETILWKQGVVPRNLFPEINRKSQMVNTSSSMVLG